MCSFRSLQCEVITPTSINDGSGHIDENTCIAIECILANSGYIAALRTDAGDEEEMIRKQISDMLQLFLSCSAYYEHNVFAAAPGGYCLQDLLVQQLVTALLQLKVGTAGVGGEAKNNSPFFREVEEWFYAVGPPYMEQL